jgi:hypothetical protein
MSHEPPPQQQQLSLASVAVALPFIGHESLLQQHESIEQDISFFFSGVG